MLDLKIATSSTFFITAFPIILLTFVVCLIIKIFAKKNFSLKDTHVVITGASRGIGRETALRYASKGARLILTATNISTLSAVAQECRQAGAEEVYILALKLGGADSARELRDFAVKTLGHVDTLILNHVLLPSLDGNSHWKEEQDFGELEEKTLVNYMSYVYIASYFRNILEASAGKICVVNSIAALVPMFKSNTYAATKSALHSFFLSYREELLEQNSRITITQVYLGLVTTESIQGAIGKHVQNVQKLSNNLFLRQFILPTKVAAKRILEATETRTETAFYPTKTLFLLRFCYFMFSNALLKGFRVIHQESEKQITSS